MRDDSANLYLRLHATAERIPLQLALVEGDINLTYAQLIAQCINFGKLLSHLQVTGGRRVCIALRNCVDFLVVAFGAWRANATLVPVNADASEHELSEYVTQSAADLIVLDSSRVRICQELLGPSLRHICYRDGVTSPWQYKSFPSSGTYESLHTAYDTDGIPAVIRFTSGSTGRPKLVCRSHQNFSMEVDALSTVTQIYPGEAVLGVVPMSFSFGFISLALMPLLMGARIHLMPRYSPENVASDIAKYKIRGLPGVPMLFQQLLEVRPSNDLSSLRNVLASGAPLLASTAEGFVDRYGINIRCSYGSAETGAIALTPMADCRPETVHRLRLLPGIVVQICTESGFNAQTGSEGIIRIRSPFAATAYCSNNDEPLLSYFDDEWFVPGDRGIIHPDGCLTLSGRNPKFINVAGNKVDPREVEATLLRFPGVLEVAVLGLPDSITGETVKAVLVANPFPDKARLREFLRRHLAQYKQPSILEFRHSLPKNESGKVIRKALLVNENINTSVSRLSN